MKYLLIALALLCLSGCASLAGNASYRYDSTDPATGRRITVRIDSARELPEGGSLEIGTDGKLKVKTGPLTSDAAAQNAMLGMFERMLERYLPPPAVAAPAAPTTSATPR